MSYSQPRPTHFNVGRLTTVSGPGTTVLEMDYDARGRTVKSRRTLDGVTYAMQGLYDSGDRLISRQFPDLDSFTYTYDAAGRPNGLSTVLTNVLWDASGRPLQQTNANGTVSNRTYSAQRGFLTAIHTTGPSVPPTLQNLQYAPDPAGILESVSSSFADESWSYAYDDLYRMTSATATPGAGSQTWTYDEAGRIETNSLAGNYSYSGGPFHAPSAVNGSSLSYDANGNLLSGGGRTLTWNADNRLTQVNFTQFVYDASGERLKKTTGGNVSRYPFGDDYEITNGVITKYLTIPGLGVIGKKVSGSGTSAGCSVALDGTYWFHNDRLGSMQAITNASGCEIKRRTYRAYGGTISQAGSHVESRGWIDQRQDSETGLTYLHARSYDSLLGVFVSPDPSHPNDAGVGLNRFIYGLGNPVHGADRSGLAMNNGCGSGPYSGGAGDCLYFSAAAGPTFKLRGGIEIASGGNKALAETNALEQRARDNPTTVTTYIDDDGDGVADRTQEIRIDDDSLNGCGASGGSVACSWNYTVTSPGPDIDVETEIDFDYNYSDGVYGAAAASGIGVIGGASGVSSLGPGALLAGNVLLWGHVVATYNAASDGRWHAREQLKPRVWDGYDKTTFPRPR